MKWTGTVTALALAIGLLAAGSVAASASTRKHAGPGNRLGSVRVHPTALKKYAVVSSGLLSAHAGSQSSGGATCPPKTVVYGGGVSIDSGALAVNVNSSAPIGTTAWLGTVNNGSSGKTTFQVYAICAVAARGYAIVSSGAVSNPAGSQTSAGVTCLKRSKVLGGGALSTSASTSVNLNTSAPEFLPGPERYGWRVAMNNASGTNQSVTAYAVCGRAGATSGYTLTAGTPVTNPTGEQTSAQAACPTGTVPLGGGLLSDATSTAVNINTTYPEPGAGGWAGSENNADATDHLLTAYVICEP